MKGEILMTQRAKFYFKPSVNLDGEYVIALEAFHEDLDVLAGGSLAFDLPEGATANQAEEIAAYLNESIRAVSYSAPKAADQRGI